LTEIDEYAMALAHPVPEPASIVILACGMFLVITPKTQHMPIVKMKQVQIFDEDRAA